MFILLVLVLKETLRLQTNAFFSRVIYVEKQMFHFHKFTQIVIYKVKRSLRYFMDEINLHFRFRFVREDTKRDLVTRI